jgi:hypothetical protein
MGKSVALCPKCGLPVDIPLHEYLGPHSPQAHVRCPHCASWLVLSLRARLLGATAAFAIVVGTSLAMNYLGGPGWPPHVVWGLVLVTTVVGIYVGARVIRSRASWQASEYGG